MGMTSEVVIIDQCYEDTSGDGELLQCHGIEWSFNQCQTNDYTAARSLVGLVDWTPQRGTPGTS